LLSSDHTVVSEDLRKTLLRTGAKRTDWPDAYPSTFSRKSARAVARSFIGHSLGRSPVRRLWYASVPLAGKYARAGINVTIRSVVINKDADPQAMMPC